MPCPLFCPPAHPQAPFRQLSDVFNQPAGCLLHLCSWVGSDREWQPPPSPPGHATWRTACFQRQLMIERYIASVQDLRDQLKQSRCSEQVSAPPARIAGVDRPALPRHLMKNERPRYPA